MEDRRDRINRFLDKYKKDLADYRERKVWEIPTYQEYAKEFNLSERSIREYVNKYISKEDRDYRRTEMRSITGKKSKGNPNSSLSISPEERKANIIKSDYAEVVIADLLQKEGWVVVKIEPKGTEEEGFKPVVDTKSIFALDKGQEIMDIFREFLLAYVNFKYPDFVCVKGNIIKFVEVKSNFLTVEKIKRLRQKRSLELMSKKGYNVSVLALPIKVKFDEGGKAVFKFPIGEKYIEYPCIKGGWVFPATTEENP